MNATYKTRVVDVKDYREHILAELQRGVTITAAAEGRVNPMTISWGMLGVEWNKPIFITFVRKGRFTHSLLEKHGEFTVNIPLNERPAQAIGHMGTKSGRDEDKISALGLHLVPSHKVTVPGIAQLPLTLECRVVYRQAQVPEGFVMPQADVDKMYPQDVPSEHFGANKDFHTAFYAEIVGAYVIEPDEE